METRKVNIISISFGLSKKYQRAMDDLIGTAVAQKKIVIFPAACNEGGRRGVSYPANHHLVFSVRAVDGLSRQANFSPFASERSSNFSILGTNILSTWPTKLSSSRQSSENEGPWERDISRSMCMSNYMAGTSFATPLMAALVANVYAYHRQHRESIFAGESNDSNLDLERYEGVERILTAMSSEDRKFRVISPWKDENNFSNYKDGRYMGWGLRLALKS